MKRLLALLMLSLCLAPPGHAATVNGATLPDTYPLPGQTLMLNGIGVRTLTIFSVRAYVAGLYLPQPNHDARAILASPGPKVILMHFLHSASKAEIERQYREGENRNCGHGECSRANEADFERLVAATPAAAVGDTLTYIFTANGMRVLANNRPIGDFANRELAFHMLAGFIGDRPPSQTLRDQLLGLRRG
jgi:hypothetical protein